MKDLDRLSIHYLDSRNPGRIGLYLDSDSRDRLDLSPSDAVELADRLLTAVRNSGYRLTARKDK